MIQARINRGRVEVQDPIPDEWEGQIVKILPLSPDDPVPDLELCLAELQALGPMEYEPGERQSLETEWRDLDQLGRVDMEKLDGSHP